MKPATRSSSASESLKASLLALRSGKAVNIEALKQKALPIARDWLEAERARLKERFLSSNDVEALLDGYAQAIDTLLETLYAAAVPAKAPALALVAVGGYGRRELFPYSDIDVLFLHDGKDTATAAAMSEAILYVLWDLGLTVGQSHRTVDEALQLAQEDITIRTNLLDARFLAGKKTIFEVFAKRFHDEIVSVSALNFVEAKLAERDARHLRYGDSRYMLEPNVKEGKGGLRDLHTLWWMARYAYPITALKDLVSMNLLSEDEYHAFDQARLLLWRVRAHLHYLAGRAEERLTFDRQHALAKAMGYNQPSANRSIERFMRRYFVAVRTVGATTRIFCALLEEEKKRKPRKSLAWLATMPWTLGAFTLDGERLALRNEQAFAENPVLMIELFRLSQIHHLDIHPRTLQLASRHLRYLDDSVRRDPKANALFLEILLAKEGPEATLRRMSESGVLGRFIPDFGRVIGQTQFNMYHVFTVDEHTLVALGILHHIEAGDLKKELPLASEVIHRIQMRRVLYLALFCHDIAKGRGGDHSELGEKLITRLAARFQFSADEIETAAWLVRQHLLFSNTAFKRDLEDPKTVQDFVRAVQSPERLKLLLVLTVADIRAVGPSVWNAWKASLMRDLFARAEECMGTIPAALKSHQTGQFKRDLHSLLPGWSEHDVDVYLEQSNPAFWAGFDLPRHAAVARMLRRAVESKQPLLVDTDHDYDRASTDIIIVTPDQHGLFSKIAGAMSLAGGNIITAKIFTLKNGMAVDMFQVQDTAGQVFDRADRLAKLSVYLNQALSGELDLRQAFAKRQPYAHTSRDALPVPGQVFIDNEASNFASVIELTGRDRRGLLYEVTRTLAELGLSIVTAHISTYGTQAADVFYVKDVFGMKVKHEAKVKQVREALLKAVNI